MRRAQAASARTHASKTARACRRAPTARFRPAANELFLASAIQLHPYTAALGKPAGFYLDWAVKTWDWLAGSGLINGENLVNDGLDASCKNNGGTTWTYNVRWTVAGARLIPDSVPRPTCLR